MSIFEQKDYREYLRGYLKQLPKGGRGELTRMAAHLRVNTTLISQILAGTRDFNAEQTLELSAFLGHTELEADYFDLLVRLARAGSVNLRRRLENKMEAIRREALKLAQRVVYDKQLTEEQKSVFYSTWYYSAIHLYTSVGEEGVTLEEIAQRFSLPRARAAEHIQFLVSCGLCAENSGRFTMGVQSTFVPQGSPHLLRHHANWRVEAIRKSNVLQESELMFTGQVSLSREDFALLRERLAEFLKFSNQVVRDSKADEVACLNIDWFWL